MSKATLWILFFSVVVYGGSHLLGASKLINQYSEGNPLETRAQNIIDSWGERKIDQQMGSSPSTPEFTD